MAESPSGSSAQHLRRAADRKCARRKVPEGMNFARRVILPFFASSLH
jgi:hypothetical protein